MTESFPRQQARTRRFTLGVPRAFRVSPDGSRVVFLRTRTGVDPVSCLWVLEVDTGTERLVADPAAIGTLDEDLPPEERARRERVRESSAGIVAYATDASVRTAVFALAGRVYAVDLAAGATPAATGTPDAGRDGHPAVVAVPTRTPALDPRPDPAGRRVAYVSGGALRVTDLHGRPDTDPAAGTGTDRPADVGIGADLAVAGPEDAAGVTFGLAEFVAAEEMGRTRGHWWSPDGEALLVARVDETPVRRWHIADPANPDRPPAEVAYPAAGTPNADVTLLLTDLRGRHTPVDWDRAAFPYLVTATWGTAGVHRPCGVQQGDQRAGADRAGPLIVVQSRGQRRMRLLTVDPVTGATAVLREDTDLHWVDVVPGVPARTAGGSIVWTVDSAGARRLLVASPTALGDGSAEPVTPADLQVRQVLDVDGDTVLFTASSDPTDLALWSHGPRGLARVRSGPGLHTGRRAGGTTVAVARSLAAAGVSVAVLRDRADGPQEEVLSLASTAEQPNLPAPTPELLALGRRDIRSAVLLPSWHDEGSGPLPVLLDPYGGPHAQRVVASRDAYLTSQWFAEQGFAVLVADGRGTPGRGPVWERAVAGDLAGPVLDDQVDALHAAARAFRDLDLSRVAIRGWSFGGYLAALAVLRRPDVFHAAVAGAPVTDWRWYDTHYTERYLGDPGRDPAPYDRCSLVRAAEQLASTQPARSDAPATETTCHTVRPLLLIHGLADDNVVAAHTLRLSSALLAAGYPHAVLPLSGVTHMTPQEVVAENLLLLQLDFLRHALDVRAVSAR